MITAEESRSTDLIVWRDAVEEQLIPKFAEPQVSSFIDQLIEFGWDNKKINLLNPEKVHLLKNFLIKFAELNWEPEHINQLTDKFLTIHLLPYILKIAAHGWMPNQINQLNMSIVENLRDSFDYLLKLKWDVEKINSLDEEIVEIFHNHILDVVKKEWSVADINLLNKEIISALGSSGCVDLIRLGWKAVGINKLNRELVQSIRYSVVYFAKHGWGPREINRLKGTAVSRLNAMELDEMLNDDISELSFGNSSHLFDHIIKSLNNNPIDIMLSSRNVTAGKINLLAEKFTSNIDTKKVIELFKLDYSLETTRKTLLIDAEITNNLGGYSIVARLIENGWQRKDFYNISKVFPRLTTDSVKNLIERKWTAAEILVLSFIDAKKMNAYGGEKNLVFLAQATGWRAKTIVQLKPVSIQILGMEKVIHLAAKEKFTPSAVNRRAYFNYRHIKAKLMQFFKMLAFYVWLPWTCCFRPYVNAEQNVKKPAANCNEIKTRDFAAPAATQYTAMVLPQ